MKEILWNLFEAAVNVYEGFNLYFFIFAFLEYNFTLPKNKIRFMCGALIHTSIIFLFNALMFYEGPWMIVYMSFTFIYSVVCIRQGITKTFFVVMSAYIWVLSANTFVCSFISNVAGSDLTDIYTKNNIERFIMIISVQLIVTYAYRITLKIFKKNGIKLNSQEWMLILIVFILSFGIILMIHMVQLNNQMSRLYHNLLLISCFALILINIVCYYMVVRLSSANSIKTENEILLTESNYRKQYAQNTQSQYEEIRRIRHDIKQSYDVILQLVSEGHYDKIKEYLQQMNQLICSVESTIDTNNTIVNAILNTKLSIAKKLGIKTLCSTVKEFHIMQIQEIDLCHMIGNLLDNAIEATLNCPENITKYIEIFITEKSSFLNVTVKNTYNPEELNLDFESNKPDKNLHGFGIKTIRGIADKYDGFVDFYTEENVFCCNVKLKIK